MSECIICGQEANVNKHHLYDDRYGYPGKFQLERCQMCGHAFLQHEFTPKRLSELYSNYYPRSGFDLDHYQPYQEQTGFLAWLDGMNSSAFRWVPKNIRILDIGCGFGESLGYHAARGCNVYGVETDENIRRVADKFGFMVHVGLFNPDIYEPDYFDFVTMDQVIEHTTDPVQTLKGVSRILNPGGTAVLTTPNAHGWGRKVFGLRWINWHAPYHLQFFSRSSMKLAAEKAGLCIETIRTITPSAWLHFQWIHLLTYPEPGRSSYFWAGTACEKKVQLGIGIRLLLRGLGLLHAARVNHLFTRFFDALGVGDNFIFVLRKP